MKKTINKKKNTSVNNKGFTLMEIIAVVIILGIIIVVSGIAVTSYIEGSRAKTYESYKKDLKVASENYLINCMSGNEEDCDMPQYGIDTRLTYNELVDKGYSDKLKDPEGNGYCDRSYVIAKNVSENGVEIEYQVCLFCSKYKSTEAGCKELTDADVTPPSCGETKNDSTEWTGENRVITVGCSDSGTGCTKNEFFKTFGEEGKVIEKATITIEDKAGNKKNCSVNAYVDKKAPTCKIEVVGEIDGNGWYNTNVTATITNIKDEGSSEDDSSSIEYGIGNSFADRDYNGNTNYQVTNGIVTVFGYVKDKVGNEGYCSKEIKVDTTRPEGTIYMGYEVYPKENVTINDSVMTINNLNKYGKIDGVIVHFYDSVGTFPSYVTNEKGEQIKINGGVIYQNEDAILKITPGVYNKLSIEITNLGELEENIKKVEVIKNEKVTSVWTNKDVSVYVEVTDSGTGLYDSPYSYDGGKTFVESNIHTYDSNSTGTVIISDQMENKSVAYPFTINKIDKTKPTKPTVQIANSNGVKIDYSSNTTYPHPVYVVGNVTSKIPTSTDTGGSGVEKYQISKNNSSWVDWSYDASSDYYGITLTGEHKRYIRSIDKAGNASNVLELILNVNTSFKLVDHILANNTAQSDINIDFSKPSSDTNGKGLYYTSTNTEDNKRTYYFRGNIENNYVVLKYEDYKYIGCNDEKCTDLSDTDIYDTFEECSKDYGEACFTYNYDMLWRIVRINEDGSVRIVLEDVVDYEEDYIDGYYGVFNDGYGNSPFNIIGYMKSIFPGFYSLPQIQYYNEYNSDVKRYLDLWYSDNINDILLGKVADSGFCNDRESTYVSGYVGSSSNKNTVYYTNGYATMVKYLSYNRIQIDGKPQFKCPEDSFGDNTNLFTVYNEKGNKSLLYPIGLLTIDEVIYAGAAYGYASNYYLENGSNWWTMTPYMVNSSYIQNCDSNLECAEEIECFTETIKIYPEDMDCINDYEDYEFITVEDCLTSRESSYIQEVCEPVEVCKELASGECTNEIEIHDGHLWIGSKNTIDTQFGFYESGIRPVINLISNIEAIQGDGTKNNPYVIDTN